MTPVTSIPVTATVDVQVTPKAEPVAKGLQTIFGYGTAIAGPLSAIVLAILQNADAIAAMPPWLYAILVGLSPLLVAITGKNRSDQKVANTNAAGLAAAAALAPVAVTDLATGASVPAHVVVEATPPATPELPEPDEVRDA